MNLTNILNYKKNKKNNNNLEKIIMYKSVINMASKYAYIKSIIINLKS